ncbi:uncharacterized protein LOC141784486 [Halichoeres trimaculatus]|uniref:uncharacterized protein LOC141784486 n=1 Tax=Halichoeres trimaculatus TaxID=147232 RepID=UPI003D9E0AC6
MRNLILITASLLFNLGWVSVSKYQTVELWSGEDAKLLCTNFSTSPTLIYWFKLVNRSHPLCISHILQPLEPARFCSGFLHGKFEMTSNMSTIFLDIKEVDLSYSGLYFCGFYLSGNPVVVSTTFVDVQEAWIERKNPMSVILVGVVVVLVIIIIFLAVRVKTLHKAHVEEQGPIQDENPGSDDPNYATVTFHPKTRGNHEPASEREVETFAIYSATR